jgi:hypothetical protein
LSANTMLKTCMTITFTIFLHLPQCLIRSLTDVYSGAFSGDLTFFLQKKQISTDGFCSIE